MTDDDAPGSGDDAPDWTGRHTLVFAIVACGLAYYFASLAGWDWAQQCADVALQTGDEGVGEICAPITPLQLSPLAFLAALLLLPDIAEFGLGGMTFKRRERKRRVKAALDKTESRVDSSIADTLTQIAHVLTATASGAASVADLDLEATQTAVERTRMASAIRALPERERLVIALYFYEHLTQAEIGEVLGVSQPRVRQILESAYARLADLLELKQWTTDSREWRQRFGSTSP